MSRANPDASDKEKAWDRQFVVYCDSPEQKQAIAAKAKESGRSLSRYALHSLLGGRDELSLSGRVDELSAEVERHKQLLETTRSEAKSLLQENTALQEERKILQLQVEALVHEVERIRQQGPGHSRIEVVGAPLLRLLTQARTSEGEQLPILERDLIIALDLVTDREKQDRLLRHLRDLARGTFVERVEVRGKPAWRWTA